MYVAEQNKDCRNITLSESLVNDNLKGFQSYVLYKQIFNQRPKFLSEQRTIFLKIFCYSYTSIFYWLTCFHLFFYQELYQRLVIQPTLFYPLNYQPQKINLIGLNKVLHSCVHLISKFSFSFFLFLFLSCK